MNIIQVDLSNKKQVDDFLHLPFSIYKDIPQWVPPLQMDERRRLDLIGIHFYKVHRLYKKILQGSGSMLPG